MNEQREQLLLQPTSTAQWHALVNEAQLASTMYLGEELESYLVFLLMRFIERPEVAVSIVAMDFLKSVHEHGQIRSQRLQEVGDKCLLFSGLFPGLAKRRKVDDHYFVDVGQNAYYALAGLSHQQVANLFQMLSEHFTALRDVLQAMRQEEGLMPTGVAQTLDQIEKDQKCFIVAQGITH